MPNESQRIESPTIEGLLRLGNQQQGNLIRALDTIFGAQSARASALSVAYSTGGGTTISSTGIGYLIAVTVVTPSTGTYGYVYDTNSPANVSSTNAMACINSSVGIQVYNIPYLEGLTVQPSSSNGHTVAIYYT